MKKNNWLSSIVLLIHGDDLRAVRGLVLMVVRRGIGSTNRRSGANAG